MKTQKILKAFISHIINNQLAIAYIILEKGTISSSDQLTMKRSLKKIEKLVRFIKSKDLANLK